MDDIFKKIEIDGTRLKLACGEKTLEAVADAVGVTKSQISMIENDNSDPSAKTLVRMLWLYGVHDVRQITRVNL